MIILNGPDKTYELKPSLQLVAALESVHGSLYQLAEELLDKTLPLSEMIDVMKMLYRHAGCAAELDDFLLRQPCTELLITFLLEVIGPVERIAAAHLPTAPFLDEMIKKFPDTEEK